MTATPPEVHPEAVETMVDARRREMAIEHLLFGTIRFLARQHPDLLDDLEGTLGHLWDPADAPHRDDDAIRDIARRFIRSLRVAA